MPDQRLFCARSTAVLCPINCLLVPDQPSFCAQSTALLVPGEPPFWCPINRLVAAGSTAFLWFYFGGGGGLWDPDGAGIEDAGLNCCCKMVSNHWPGRDALEGKGPQRQPQKPLDRPPKEVAKAVGGGYCRLQMPLTPALLSGRQWLGIGWAPCTRRGAGYLPAFQCIPGCGGAEIHHTVPQ